jgi:hypothetical protein
MPAVIPFLPLIAAGVGTAGTVYGAHKASEGAKLDPATQQMQNQAMLQQQQRAQMMQPLLERLVGGMGSRLPASYQAGGAQAPSMAQMRSPGVGQALSSMGQGLPGPTARRRVPYQS